MPTYPLANLDLIPRAFGRGVVYYAVETDPTLPGADPDPIVWDGTTELFLKQLGATEGDIRFNPNGRTAALTLPEESGDAPLEVIDVGGAPTLEIPLFLADPDLIPIVSPRGVNHGGFSRICDAAQRTLVIFPEAMLKTSGVGDACTYASPSWDAVNGFMVGGNVLSAAQETLLELAFWAWAGYFDDPGVTWKGEPGDAGKAVESVTFHLVVNHGMPDGHYLWTRGDPSTFGIELGGAS